MAKDMGEYVVGAYLKLVLDCDFIEYGVRPSVGGQEGQAEFDVVGFNFESRTAYLCEVATHLDGLNYGSGNASTIKKISEKHRRQRAYAKARLANFEHHRFMLWSPYVPRGKLTKSLTKISGLELVINGEYRDCVEKLRLRARRETRSRNEPFFRALQIIEHMKDWPHCHRRDPDSAHA